jgi:hypothetical protein
MLTTVAAKYVHAMSPILPSPNANCVPKTADVSRNDHGLTTSFSDGPRPETHGPVTRTVRQPIGTARLRSEQPMEGT